MTGKGHHLTGLAAGVLLAGVLRHVIPEQIALLAIPAGWFGGVAPDRLEFALWTGAKRRSLIAHRTITHWWFVWGVLGAWAAYSLLDTHVWYGLAASAWVSVAVLGVAWGALAHIACDWPNPMGVPGWVPWRRHSLRWWRSGQREVRMVLASAALAAIPWLVVLR